MNRTLDDPPRVAGASVAGPLHGPDDLQRHVRIRAPDNAWRETSTGRPGSAVPGHPHVHCAMSEFAWPLPPASARPGGLPLPHPSSRHRDADNARSRNLARCGRGPARLRLLPGAPYRSPSAAWKRATNRRVGSAFGCGAALSPRCCETGRAGDPTRRTMEATQFTTKATQHVHLGCVRGVGGSQRRHLRRLLVHGLPSRGTTHLDAPQPHREQKLDRVRAGTTHAALVFDGDDCVGWCQFGPPDENFASRTARSTKSSWTSCPTGGSPAASSARAIAAKELWPPRSPARAN